VAQCLSFTVKICFLLSTFAYDGIKRSVVHFANAMQAMGHEVWVGVLHEWSGKLSLRSELRLPPERVVSWDGLGQGRREWAMYRFFRQQRFDVVHANTIKMNHVGRWMALAARVPCVVASEDNLCLNRSWRTRAEDRLLARLGGAVVMISDAVARSFLETEKLPPEKVHTIYYGIPVEEIRSRLLSREQLANKRKELGIEEGPTVVCAARMDPSKSIETLIEAARLVVDRLPQAQFLVAGDGPELWRLQELRDQRFLQNRFRFLGARSDIYEILQLADVVTLCSLWEGLGYSLMEAMVLGKPLVGTNVSGINEIIISERNGRLVPPRCPSALAEALLAILTSPARARECVAGGAQVLAERFDIDTNARKLLELYERVLKS
jgi:glycosyltransferase involved in cell wall biosynthesis